MRPPNHMPCPADEELRDRAVREANGRTKENN